MTPERRAWWKLALRQKMGYQECQRKYTSTEFIEACVLMDEEWHEVTKLEHYLAQVSCTNIQTAVKDPTKFNTEDFILKFTSEEQVKKKEMSAEEKEAGIKRMKGVWTNIVGSYKKVAQMNRHRARTRHQRDRKQNVRT